MGEIDRTSVILRDILNPSFENIYVNDLALSKEIKRYISTIAPEKEGIVKFVSTEVPIFDHFGVDKQITSSLGRTVSFKNGAYLIIEHTEAFHVIDVNSGNRVKLGDDQESNALEVNLAAADEVARQLQLRDMGGIIVIDFIDMQQAENRQKLFDKMRSAMELDRAKHTILPLSKFGLMQITRQRVRPEMTVTTTETCPVCHGTGKADAAVLVIDKIEDQLEFLVEEKKIKNLVLKSQFGLNYTTGFNSTFVPKWSEADRKVDINELTVRQDNSVQWVWSNTANYSIELGKNNISAVIGTDAKK